MSIWKRTAADKPQENKGFPLLPKGRYRFMVADSKHGVWAKSGETCWDLRLEVIEPANVAGRVFHRLKFPGDVNPTASASDQAKQQRWRDEAVFDHDALGIGEVDKETDMEVALGKMCTGTVAYRSYTAKSGDTVVTEHIRSLHPDLGPGSVDKSAPISKGEAESELPF